MHNNTLPPQAKRFPRCLPLPFVIGSTPATAAILERLSIPSSSHFPGMVREGALPKPGMLRYRLSLVRRMSDSRNCLVRLLRHVA